MNEVILMVKDLVKFLFYILAGSCILYLICNIFMNLYKTLFCDIQVKLYKTWSKRLKHFTNEEIKKTLNEIQNRTK